MCVSFLWPSPKFPTLFSVYFQYVPWENLQFEAQILYPCTLKVVGSHSRIVFLTWCSHKPSMSPKTLYVPTNPLRPHKSSSSPQTFYVPTNPLRPHKSSTSPQTLYVSTNLDVPTSPLRPHKPWCPHKPWHPHKTWRPHKSWRPHKTWCPHKTWLPRQTRRPHKTLKLFFCLQLKVKYTGLLCSVTSFFQK